VLRGEVAARARRLAAEEHAAFALDPTGALLWGGAVVGRLTAGESVLTPRIELRAGDFLDGEARERVRQRLLGFVRSEIERHLAPLFAAQALPLGPAGRGLVFQLADALGCLPAAEVATSLKALDRPSRRALGRLGVRFGTETIYVEPLLGQEPTRFRALLWAIYHDRAVPALPGARNRGRAVAVDTELPLSFYAAIGRRVLGALALRPDRLERLAAAVRARARAGRFAADGELAALAGVAPSDLTNVLLVLGYRAVIEGGDQFFIAKPRRSLGPPVAPRRKPPRDGNPFAKLKELRFA
jgi:ATP-dependent RNA helicase SUPV3L1/SUV3